MRFQPLSSVFPHVTASKFTIELLKAPYGFGIVADGVIAHVLLMFALTQTPASAASLLLNAEGVFTALLAWFAFKENFDRRIALGMLAIGLFGIQLRS